MHCAAAIPIALFVKDIDAADDGAEALNDLFFFQAEDGIRDGHVTGVQTCALPICFRARRSSRRSPPASTATRCSTRRPESMTRRRAGKQIGRASCRERV